MNVRTIFLGTPDVAAKCLDYIADLPFMDIVGVITMPDRKQGRNRELQKSPVKIMAEKHSIPVYDASDSASLSAVLEKIDFDLGIVIAYGALISKKDLGRPKHGFVNIHFSLLPEYRGASPVQAALRDGREKTGVTLFQLVPKMDAGPIIGARLYEIPPTAAHDMVFHDLIPLSCELLKDDLQTYIQTGTVHEQEGTPTYCTKMTRESGTINWQEHTAKDIYNMFRAYKGWPGVFTFMHGKRLKLHEVSQADTIEEKPGTLIEKDGALLIATKDGSLQIHELQLEGKKRMSSTDFIRGNAALIGERCE